MKFWEAIYIQEYHKISLLVTEQQPFEHNTIFDCTQATTPPYDNHGLAKRITTQDRQYSEQTNKIKPTHLHVKKSSYIIYMELE